MAYPTALPNLAGFVGTASETTIGTGIAATVWTPLMDADAATDPGIIIPEVLKNTRSVASYSALGEFKPAGKFTIPLFVDQGYQPFAAAIGSDAVTGTNPATHTIKPDQPNAKSWKTLTVEYNRAGLDSRQFAGAYFNKMSLKFTSKEVATVMYDWLAMTDANVTPTTPSWGTSNPLALADYTVSVLGSPDISVMTTDINLDNGAKQYWTFNSSNYPQAIPPLKRVVTGQWTNIVQSATYYTDMLAATTGAFVFTATQGSNSVEVNLPKIIITKIAEPLKVGEVFIFTVDFQALWDSVTSLDIEAIVVNTLAGAFV